MALPSSTKNGLRGGGGRTYRGEGGRKLFSIGGFLAGGAGYFPITDVAEAKRRASTEGMSSAFSGSSDTRFCSAMSRYNVSDNAARSHE